MTPHDHAVNFYDDDADVVADVARYVAEGLLADERVIVIATPEHRSAIDHSLALEWADVDQARKAGHYVVLDAARTLATFMVDGVPDPERFARTIGDVIDSAAADGHPVRAFGEMVALLWADGNVAGAIQLEELWNGLAQIRDFELLCAYSMDVLDDHDDLRPVNLVCALHSDVIPPRSYASDEIVVPAAADVTEVSEVFVPVPDAARAVRRFVGSVLVGWDAQDLVPMTTLVASELATNAITHATSPFRVTVRRTGSAVRISVEDTDPAQPELRESGPLQPGGRGVLLVAKLSQSWGHESHDSGKVVWSEFALS